jgi:hypothetical protein
MTQTQGEGGAAFELPQPNGVEAPAGRLAPLRFIVLPPPLRGRRPCRGSPLRGGSFAFHRVASAPAWSEALSRGAPKGFSRVRTALGLVFAFLSKTKTCG